MARRRHLARSGVKQCIFCGGKTNSREDLWSVWILENFPAPKAGIFANVGEDWYADQTQKAITLRGVCREKCNGGWMSGLEKAAKPTLSALARDLAIPLSLEQQALVSQWALMKAMVWEYFAPESRRLFYLDWHKEGMKNSREIPEDTTVWLGRWGGRPVLQSVARDGIDDRPGWPADTTFRVWITEMIFGRLVIQVVSERSLIFDDRRIKVRQIPGPSESAAVQVWPPTGGIVNWPPKLTIDRDVPLSDFQRRWMGTSRVA